MAQHLTLDELLALKLQRPEPITVVHCGSTSRAREAFAEWQLKDTLAGKIVLTIGAHKNDASLGITPEQAIELDILHLRKIERAAECYGITFQAVSKIVNGQRWNHVG